jgi:hypothetical protein
MNVTLMDKRTNIKSVSSGNLHAKFPQLTPHPFAPTALSLGLKNTTVEHLYEVIPGDALCMNDGAGNTVSHYHGSCSEVAISNCNSWE